MTSLLDRAYALANKCDASIQGADGSKARRNIVDLLAVGLGLTDDETFRVLIDSGWNARCVPPWVGQDLQRCVSRIRATSRRMPGYLLADRDRRSGHRPQSSGKAAPSAPLTPAPRRGYTDEELAIKAAKQAALPPPRPMTNLEQEAVAVLRNCPRAAVEILAQNHRFMMDGSRPDCFLITDGRTDGRGHRQFRRFDGADFHHGEKSDNVKGSAAKGFFSLNHNRRLDHDELVFLTEGSISLLETASCQWLCEGRARRWHLLAAHSAASTFAAEPELLQSLAGHYVRIMHDENDKGIKAARAWRDELRAVGCRVQFATVPGGFQDLKLLLAAGSDGIPAIRSLMSYPIQTKGGQS